MIPGWLDEIEEEVVSCLCTRGRMSARELGSALGISEASAVSYIYLLASEGRLTIEAVRVAERPSGSDGGSEREVDHGVLAGGAVGRSDRGGG